MANSESHSKTPKQPAPPLDQKPHPLKRIMRSFSFAAAGIAYMIRHQTNAWVHLAATGVVIGLGLWLRLDRIECCFLVLATGLVWSMEAANSAIELLADAVHPAHHPLIGRAKDVAAGGVLLAAVAAAIVGVIVILPPFLVRVGLTH